MNSFCTPRRPAFQPPSGGFPPSGPGPPLTAGNRRHSDSQPRSRGFSLLGFSRARIIPHKPDALARAAVAQAEQRETRASRLTRWFLTQRDLVVFLASI